MNSDKGARLIALAERCEGASADEQKLLLMLAFDAPNPLPTPDLVPLRDLWESLSVGPHFRRASFLRMITANAYESAAMFLVPSGYGWRLWMPNSTSAELPRVTLWGNGRAYAPRDSEAATPALALTAACLRTLAHLESGNG